MAGYNYRNFRIICFFKNKKRKAIILDIPLLLENKLDQKSDIIVFVQSKKSEIIKNKEFFENAEAVFCQSKIHAEILKKNI